jgi:cytochrome b561
MQWKSTADRYGVIAIAIHWLAAVAIIGLIVSGFRIANFTDPIAKAALLRVHAGMGIAVLVLTLARIAWWLFADAKPHPQRGTPSLQNRLAAAVHVIFYIVVLGMAASGIGMLVLSGAGKVLFANVPGALPDFWNYPPRIPHGIGGRALVALLVLHVGAALYHQFVLRDRIFARMGIGRS